MPGEPHPLTIRIRPSPALLAVVLAAHLGGGVALFLMDLPFAATAPLMLLLLVSAALAVRAQAQKRGLSLVLAADGALQVCCEGQDFDVWARVLPGTVLFPALSWFALAWTARDGRLRHLRLMLVAAEVFEDGSGNAQWRRLRTWLRHRVPDSGPDTLSPADAA
jgi:hypothetical protein